MIQVTRKKKIYKIIVLFITNRRIHIIIYSYSQEETFIDERGIINTNHRVVRTELTDEVSWPYLLPRLLSLENDLCLSRTTGQIAVGGRMCIACSPSVHSARTCDTHLLCSCNIKYAHRRSRICLILSSQLNLV